MSDIFLSYNRQDQLRADQFVRGFEAAGLSVWWDVTLRAGDAYDQVTEDALRSARAVVVMWSTRAVASRWVRAEATLAQRLETFVPCMIEPCERPIMFELTQTADLTHWQGDIHDPAWQSFVSHVREVVKANRAKGTTAPAPAAPQRPVSAAAPGNERRQVTFLAGEIANGHRMAMELDPEDWHELVVAVGQAFDAVVLRFGGSIRWNGHRFNATFGYPIAHEDAAQRAIQAGLALIAAAAQPSLLPADWSDGALGLKIGIHSGDVLVTVNQQGEAELFGEGAASAAALRDRAESGRILASEAVRVLAGRSFGFAAAGDGTDPDASYTIDASAPRGSGRTVGTPFVGREEELQLLTARWRKVVSGASQIVLLRGDPGIGKSRLVEEFRRSLDPDGHFWIVLQGSSMFPNTPYHALAQMVQGLVDESGSDPVEVLGMRLAEFGLAHELADTILDAADLRRQQGQPADSGGADQRRARIQGGLINALFDMAQRRPLVLLVDDLQWIDPSTLEIVEMLVQQADEDRILVLATARPEFQPPWPEHEHHSRITLGRLGQDEVRRMVVDSLGETAIAAETLAMLVDRADGVPLFAEELLRTVAEGQQDSAAALPATLRALLVARMDRLGEARELLQVAAVLGRAFPHDLLADVSGYKPSDLAAMLAQLAEEQLLVVRGAAPAANYRFRHALLQDAAYETLPKKRQRELHRRAAQTIVDRFPQMAASQRELLASHWTRAGAVSEAVAAWRAAGDEAYRRAASKEAAVHFRAGLALIGKLPESAERDETELTLWSMLNRALQQARGYADPQTVEAADKAVELAKKAGSLDRVLVEEAQLWRAAITAGDYARADAVADQLTKMAAETDENGTTLSWISYFQANARVQTSFYTGRIGSFENDWAIAAEALEDPQQRHSPNDDAVLIGVGSLAAWVAGRSDLARQRIAQAIAMAEKSQRPYALAVAHHFAGTLAAFERDREATLDHSRRAVEVCEANGYDYIRHLARAKIGWAGSGDGISAADIAEMRDSLEQMIANDALVGMIVNLNRLAIALEVAGQSDEAFAITDRALSLNPQERVALPHTLEIRGRLLERRGEVEEAIACYREGIAAAVAMGAVALELSLALHLARLLAARGETPVAVAALEATLSRCDPATNSPDLDPVRQLAAELRVTV